MGKGGIQWGVILDESVNFLAQTNLFSVRKSGANTYDVTMDDGAILVGQFGLPVELGSKFKLELL